MLQRFESYVEQVKPESGTGPFDVGGLNVQFTVSTRVSQRPNSPSAAVWSWNSLIVAEVKDTSKPPTGLVVDRVTNGKGAMPPFRDSLDAAQIQAVADYVASAAGR